MRLPRIISQAELFERRAGIEISRDDFIEGQAQKRRLDWQSKDLVAKFREGGIDMEMEDSELSLVSLDGKIVEPVITYKNSNIIPSNQAKNTNAMLTDLTYFSGLREHKGKLRMLVGKGRYAQLHTLRASQQDLRRKVPKLNGHKFLKENDIEIQFANIEHTVQIKKYEWQDGVGQWTRPGMLTPWFNVHTHIMVRCGRRLGPDLWRRFLAIARMHMPGDYLRDAGKLEKAAECCKYMHKPDDLLKLTPYELCELYRQTRGLRVFQPMGAFKRMRRKLRADGHRLKKFKRPDGSTYWNRVQYQPPPKKDKRDLSPDEKLLRLLMREERQMRLESPGAAGRVLAFVPPSPRWSQRMEGAMLVRCYRNDFKELLRQNHCEEKVSIMRGLAEKPDPSIWDTTTITVQKDEPFWMSDPPPIDPDVALLASL